ncbi:prepilin-type cleavage/methylation domain-containing protein [Xylella fastidiosa subsp. pauca]|uniref:pilin n=1 Tax=Xylella fastidiosa TaxID=2371 RepID=UPI0005835097|nr:pilin [Xylella fastidiosa]ARO68673.1 prepilin-type cleavage/methylation domain-containing protein [Xylella fastidiosa subsp. pauca]AVI20761.1 prepilin-type N-terminal cleavage/methylation domain-containing protein [Xylella fastidiosa]AVI22790.1 prepilin-type N-terminal cleavage/methylation domain-containing protein [Xylella fastidiosa]KIA57930.1 ferrous iron transporter B [Xylella fastidiosa]KXB10411.1 ferrous iron transporter B [Xylella fastidiosa]
MKKRQQGFTLLEVMVTLIVAPVLAAIALPLYQHYVAKAQVTAALADITPGKVGVEMRLIEGNRTKNPSDISLHAPTTRCRSITVDVKAPTTRTFIHPDGRTITEAATTPMPSITCIINGTSAVDGKFIQWMRISDAGMGGYITHENGDEEEDGLAGKWFCLTDVDEELRPITCIQPPTVTNYS